MFLLHLKAAVKNCFVRGSVVRYVHIPRDDVDVELLQDASRRGLSASQSAVKA